MRLRKGDIVNRHKYTSGVDAGWTHGYGGFTVKSATRWVVELFGIEGTFDSSEFNLIMRASKRIVDLVIIRKVGPFSVHVRINQDPEANLCDMPYKHEVYGLLEDLDSDYGDPEMGTEDLLERLQDLMESRDDVRRYGYFQHNGGHGAIVMFEEG